MKWLYPHLLVLGGLDEMEGRQLILAQEPNWVSAQHRSTIINQDMLVAVQSFLLSWPQLPTPTEASLWVPSM